MPEPLTVDDFTGTEHEVYPTEVPGHGPIDLDLVTTERRGEPRPFSLVFRGPLEPQLEQGTYAVQHPRFEEPLPLFLVPIARKDDGMRYEAIFG